MRELSIFVDESGDFGAYEKHAPYYIITMVLHDQQVDLNDAIRNLNEALAHIGYADGQAVHTEPLIRRESPYKEYSPNERRAIFSKLYYFTLNCDIKYKSFVFKKSEYNDIFKLEARMARELSGFIRENLSFFQSFDSVILYYDNGQHELNRILNTVLAMELTRSEQLLFHSKRDLRKDFLKGIHKKQF